MGTTPIYGFPYPDPSDLVANYPALGQQLAEDVEDEIAASSVVVQVKSVSVTASFTTSSTSYVDWTGLTVSITPTSATNKVLATAFVTMQTTDGGLFQRLAIVRTSTVIAENQTTSIGNGYTFPQSVQFLDSPATTSATTYKVQVRTQSAIHPITAISGLTYTITVMEVKP